MATYMPFAVLEVNTHKGKLGFSPRTFQKDPLLRGKNRRSIRLFEPDNDLAVREGEALLVQMENWAICPDLSKDGRIIVKIGVHVLAREEETERYFSRHTHELVKKFFVDAKTFFEERTFALDETDRLALYLEC